MKKVILDLEDFNKIAKYITTQSIPFSNASKAVEITEILKKVRIAEVEEKVIDDKINVPPDKPI
jgi:hypothetical protein